MVGRTDRMTQRSSIPVELNELKGNICILISNRMILDGLSAIIRDVKKSYSPDIVVGILEGGRLPALLASKMLNVPLMYLRHRYQIRSENGLVVPVHILRKRKNLARKRVLLVDDFVSKGGTIEKCVEILRSIYKVRRNRIRTAALVIRSGQQLENIGAKPDFFAYTSLHPVKFPWDLVEYAQIKRKRRLDRRR